MQIPRSVTAKRLRAESFVASFRVGAQEAEETALSRTVWKRGERETKRMEEDGEENIEEREQRWDGEETEAGLDETEDERVKGGRWVWLAAALTGKAKPGVSSAAASSSVWQLIIW